MANDVLVLKSRDVNRNDFNLVELHAVAVLRIINYICDNHVKASIILSYMHTNSPPNMCVYVCVYIYEPVPAEET